MLKKGGRTAVGYDVSALTPGTKLQAESDGVWYTAEVLQVSASERRRRAPVRVHFSGWSTEYDEWLAGDRLRSKLIPRKSEAPGKKGRPRTYSLADQVARFARAKAEKNERYLNISSVYDASLFKSKKVLIVGGNRGLGLEIVKQLSAAGAQIFATCRASPGELDSMPGVEAITGVEVTSEEAMHKMAKQIIGPLDYAIFVSGYFPDIVDNLDSVQVEEAVKQFDICAMGPLRCVAALKKASLLKGCKVAVVSSQAGSAKWRQTQNKNKGGDYGHHMCRAACNMGGVLMSEELKQEQVPVVLLHPGFNRTSMTQKYAHIWDIEGAVEPADGAKRVLYETGQITMASSGKFINCEDGLLIPW